MIKGGCQSERNVVTHDSKSDLPLIGVRFKKPEILTPPSCFIQQKKSNLTVLVTLALSLTAREIRFPCLTLDQGPVFHLTGQSTTLQNCCVMGGGWGQKESSTLKMLLPP